MCFRQQDVIDSTIWRFASPMAVDREHFESQARNDKRALASFLFQQLRQLGDIAAIRRALSGHNNQALSGSIDCSDFSCGWPMQAGRPFSRNSL